jgi:hypothetical protein
MGRRAGIAAAILALGTLGIAAIVLSRPGLPSQPVASVPAMLSEPAGIPGAKLELAPGGLGQVRFGLEPEPVISLLSQLLGEPVDDRLLPCDSDDDLVRFVRWGNLSAAFADGRFSGYIIGIYYPGDSPELPLATAEGVALRATARELAEAYGDRLEWTGQEESGFGEPVDAFGIDGYDVDNRTPTGLGGYVEGGIDDGQVITFNAGQPCGA